jgi:diguanylate cyclase (GGDEF)-like protein
VLVPEQTQNQPQVEPRFREDAYSSENTLKRIFLGACGLQTLVVLLVIVAVALWGHLPRGMFVGYSALLLWGEVVLVFAFWRMLTYTRRVEQDLRHKSFVDELTGIFNYRYLEQRMREEYERTRRHGGRTAVLFMDLDGFKKVNDRFGHELGNTVLRELAHLLLEQTRHSDVLGRMGGDEFLALLPETPREEARLLAERITEAVRQYRFELEDNGEVDFVRISVGVAAYPDNGETMDRVMAAADQAVYKSKQQGGDSVSVSDEFLWAESSDAR